MADAGTCNYGYGSKSGPRSAVGSPVEEQILQQIVDELFKAGLNLPGTLSPLSRKKNNSPQKDKSPHKDKSPKKDKSPNKGKSPKKDESPNKDKSPKKDESPNKDKSPKKDESLAWEKPRVMEFFRWELSETEKQTIVVIGVNASTESEFAFQRKRPSYIGVT